MKKNIFVCGTFFFLATSLLTAQDASPSQKPWQGAERAKLAFLVGTYATATHVMPSPMAPDGGSGKGTTVMKWGLDSMFIVLDEQSVNKVFGEYKGHGMLGYNRQDSNYVLTMFNNFGDTPQYRGTFNVISDVDDQGGVPRRGI